MNAKTDPKNALAALPAELADVALIAAPVCAAAGSMSVSWWNEEVRAGRAPQPVVRMPRCTRWRLADVRAFWRARAEQSAEGAVTAALVQSRAARASAKAREPRTANKAALQVAA